MKYQELIKEYIYNNGSYPFNNHTRFIITSNISNIDILNLLSDLLKDFKILEYSKHQIFFYTDNFEYSIKDIFETISLDYGENINIHEGYVLNKNIEGKNLANYFEAVIKAELLKLNYSDITNIWYIYNSQDIMKDYYHNIIKPVLKKSNNYIIINTLFDNNLNILKTSKELFMNRNSLILRIDNISKAIGYNILNIKIASLVLYFMNKKL